MDLDFREPDRFTTGTVGEPGQRVFYIQVAEGDHVATFRLEKQQVNALADSMAELLTDVADVTAVSDAMELTKPIVAEWIVGAMGVAYDESSDRILVAVQEARPADEADPAEGDLAADEPVGARILLTRQLAAAFVVRTHDIVASGRPPCVFCGMPKDAGHHNCPRMN